MAVLLNRVIPGPILGVLIIPNMSLYKANVRTQSFSSTSYLPIRVDWTAVVWIGTMSRISTSQKIKKILDLMFHFFAAVWSGTMSRIVTFPLLLLLLALSPQGHLFIATSHDISSDYQPLFSLPPITPLFLPYLTLNIGECQASVALVVGGWSTSNSSEVSIFEDCWQCNGEGKGF